MCADFQLWGTFSVADHTRVNAFVADVLVFDRLIVPVPAGDDDERWARNEWDVDLQRRLLDVLREGDPNRVLEIPWDEQKRAAFKHRTAELASATAFDMASIQAAARNNPNTPAQELTRLVLRGDFGTPRDQLMVEQARHGLPAQDVQVVGAYATGSEFFAETRTRELDTAPAAGSDLLGGFVWPFLVPDEDGRDGLDLLKRAVEFANQPEVRDYRLAYHQWRASVVLGGRTPAEAATQVEGQIAAYGEWMSTTKVRTRVATACTVFGVTAGVLTGIAFPLLGAPVLAGSIVGGGSAAAGLVNLVTARAFRRPPAALNSAGALFWEARQHLR